MRAGSLSSLPLLLSAAHLPPAELRSVHHCCCCVLAQRLEAIGKAVRERGVDVVLYVDRVDAYKVDTLDRKVGWGWGAGVGWAGGGERRQSMKGRR